MKKVLLFLFSGLMFAGLVQAVELTEIAIAQSVKDRVPQGIANTFSASVEKLYCYTKLAGGKEGETIIHRWKLNGQTIREFSLKISGPTWRTYSCKWLNGMKGKWTVDIIYNGKVLRSKDFIIQ